MSSPRDSRLTKQGVRDLSNLGPNSSRRRSDSCRHRFEYEDIEYKPGLGTVRVDRCPYCGKYALEPCGGDDD